MRTRVITAFIYFIVYILSAVSFAATWEESAKIAGSVTQLKASPQWYHGIMVLLDESAFPFAAVGNQVIGALRLVIPRMLNRTGNSFATTRSW